MLDRYACEPGLELELELELERSSSRRCLTRPVRPSGWQRRIVLPTSGDEAHDLDLRLELLAETLGGADGVRVEEIARCTFAGGRRERFIVVGTRGGRAACDCTSIMHIGKHASVGRAVRGWLLWNRRLIGRPARPNSVRSLIIVMANRSLGWANECPGYFQVALWAIDVCCRSRHLPRCWLPDIP